MIEIVNENRASALKIFRDLNDEEKEYLMVLIASENPEACLRAVTEAIHSENVRKKVMEKYENDNRVRI